MSKVMLCAPSLPREITDELSARAEIPCVRIPPCRRLPTPTMYHPDMLFFNLPETDEAVTSAAYYAANSEFFGRFTSPRLIYESAELSSDYPHDILFDALSIGGTLYCKPAYTSEKIKCRFGKTVSIRQGYAACSTLKLSEYAAITADSGIAAALTRNGIRVLKISEGGIALPGYSYGFIGGASTVIGKSVFFFGGLKHLPNCREIAAFCRAEGFSVTDFPDIELTDHGGIRTLTYGAELP